MKDRQTGKIKELRQALSCLEHLSVRDQAHLLGLHRSTAWVVLKCTYKSSGLSAAVINRLLQATGLPPQARIKIYEYIEEKGSGQYGHNRSQRQRFLLQLSSQHQAESLEAKVDSVDVQTRMVAS